MTSEQQGAVERTHSLRLGRAMVLLALPVGILVGAQMPMLELAASVGAKVPPAALDAVSCAGEGCVAVGGAGSVRVSGDEGRSWTRRRVPSTALLYGVSCATVGRCVAVGDRGTILATSDGGRRWVRIRSSTGEPLFAVDCNPEGPCIAVGENGTIVCSRDGGRKWRTVAIVPATSLDGVSCPTAGRCVASGSYPVMKLSTDRGMTWHTVSIPIFSLVEMEDVSCATTEWCVAVGTNGTVISSVDGGTTWTDDSVPPSGELHGVTCQPIEGCIVVGTSGVVLTESAPDSPWKASAPSTGEMLLGAVCASSSCLAVGGGGTVIRSTDAGSSWHTVTGTPAASEPVRMMFVGDSVSYTLADGLSHQAAAYGVTIINDALLGCGILQGGPVQTEGRLSAVTGPCASSSDGWPSLYREDTAGQRPQVSVLLLGRWDLIDRFHDGRWIWPGAAGYSAYFLSQLREAIDILSGGGAHVVLLTTPILAPGPLPAVAHGRDICHLDGRPIWCENLPSRVIVLNRLLHEGAADSGGRATVLNFGAQVNPGKSFTRTVDGVTVRAPDGVHFGVPGTDWLAPWLVPRLKEAAPGP